MSNPLPGNDAPRAHFLQFYGGDDRALIRNATNYLYDGLQLGDGLLAIATTEHQGLLRTELEAEAAGEGRLVFLDAEEMVASIMAAGPPDWPRFSANDRRCDRSTTDDRGSAESAGLRRDGRPALEERAVCGGHRTRGFLGQASPIG